MLNRVKSNQTTGIKTVLQAVKGLRSNSTHNLTGMTAAMALVLTTALQPLSVTAAHGESEARNYIRITSENAHRSKFIKLGLDKSIVVDLPAEANDVLVANPEVADAVMRTSKRIYLFGKEVGQTNVFVFDGSGKQIAAMEILIERDIAGLEESLTRLIPNSDVRAEMINDNIVLTGTVQSPSDANKAIALAEIFVKGGENTKTQESGLAAIFGDTRESEVVNLLKIEGEDQVLLKVVIAEIRRDITKQLGISSTFTKDSSDGFSFTGLASGVLQQSVPGGSAAVASITQGATNFTSNLKAMEIAGVIRTLAEPSLTAVSGEEANFTVGGNWQVPSSVQNEEGGGQKISFTEKPYGVSLAFTPVVLSEGRISLKLRTEVSEPSSTGASTAGGGAPLYGYRTRIASTTVELPSGGSMAIAGLVQDDIKQVVSGMPGLSRIPVFGSLFRSREFQRNETELVMIITPYLVRPVARQKLAQPDENFQAASEPAGMFMGRVNRVYGTKQGDLPKGRYTGSVGFILK